MWLDDCLDQKEKEKKEESNVNERERITCTKKKNIAKQYKTYTNTRQQ